MRVRSRRRSRPSLQARLRVFWLLIVVVLVAGAWAGYAIVTWPGFVPRAVAVDGNVVVSASEILERAAIPLDRNVWLLDKPSAEHRIETIPRVASARIHRALPARVTIVVTERIPFACLDVAGTSTLTDETGHVLEHPCPVRGGRPDLTIVLARSDPALFARMVTDAKLLAGFGAAPVRLALDRFEGLEATLPSGLVLQLGEDGDLGHKAALVAPILAAYGPRARTLRALDLRAPTTPVAVFK